MDILGLGYLGLQSPTAKAWREYGPDVLGMELNLSRNDDSVYLRMDEQDYRLAVHPGPQDRLGYLGWELRHRPAWEAAVERLQSSGYDVVMGDAALEDQRGVHAVATLLGPDGYQHEFYYGRLFHPDFRPGRPMRGGFSTGKYGLGHVVLVVPEITPELDLWYRDTMGFRWFGHGPRKDSLVFYRPRLNPHSHSIAYAPMAGKHGLYHIGIEVEDLDDLGVAYDLVREAGLPIYRTMGRHTQDPVISFYSYSPSGGIIEYIWGTVDMPEEDFQEKKPRQLSVWGHQAVNPGLFPRTIIDISDVAP